VFESRQNSAVKQSNYSTPVTEFANGTPTAGSDPKLTYAVLDPAAFKNIGGPTIAENINRKLIAAKLAPFREAANTRVGKKGPMSGWNEVRLRIIGLLDGKGAPKGVPMLYCFDTCRVLIRTIPTLQHDPARPEDVLKGPTDHAVMRFGMPVCRGRGFALSRRPEPFDPLRDVYQPPRDYTDVQSSVKLM
jgi:hypothetical protein